MPNKYLGISELTRGTAAPHPGTNCIRPGFSGPAFRGQVRSCGGVLCRDEHRRNAAETRKVQNAYIRVVTSYDSDIVYREA
jgi:hypothetical protein